MGKIKGKGQERPAPSGPGLDPGGSEMCIVLNFFATVSHVELLPGYGYFIPILKWTFVGIA
jgi:hypothetical protein